MGSEGDGGGLTLQQPIGGRRRRLGQLGRRENKGDDRAGAVADVAVTDAARERGEEAKRGGERAREDREGVGGRRGRWEEAELAKVTSSMLRSGGRRRR